MEYLELKTKILYDLYPDKDLYVGNYGDNNSTNELLKKNLIEVCGKDKVNIRLTKKGWQIVTIGKTYEDFLRFERMPKYTPQIFIITPKIIKYHIGIFWFKILKNPYFIGSVVTIIGGVIALIIWFFIYPFFRHLFPGFDLP